MIVRALGGDVIAMSPPLVITEAEVDRTVEVLDRALARVGGEIAAPA